MWRWAANFPSWPLNPHEITPVNIGFVGSKGGLDLSEKRNVFSPYRGWNPGPPACNLVPTPTVTKSCQLDTRTRCNTQRQNWWNSPACLCPSRRHNRILYTVISSSPDLLVMTSWPSKQELGSGSCPPQV